MMKNWNTPRFRLQEDQFTRLQQFVRRRFNRPYIKRHNGPILFFGSTIFLIYLSLMIALWLSTANDPAYFVIIAVLGILCVPMILVIGHESVHGNFTTWRWLNSLGKSVFYFLGTTPYFWSLRHINAHHAYTNIKEWDMDIEQSKLIRLSEQEPHAKHHRYQYLYMPFLFMLYTLNWFFIRDVQDVSNNRFGGKHVQTHPTEKIVYLVLAKLWHLSFLVGIPVLLGASIVQAVFGFFLFHVMASLTTTLVLISTHIGENHDLLSAGEGQHSESSWIEHQIRTTGDFCTHSDLALYFFGGFNHHLTHHLFPNIPFRFYPQITPLVKNYCIENDLPYHHYDDLLKCASSHFKRLKKYSQPHTMTS